MATKCHFSDHVRSGCIAHGMVPKANRSQSVTIPTGREHHRDRRSSRHNVSLRRRNPLWTYAEGEGRIVHSSGDFATYETRAAVCRPAIVQVRPEARDNLL